MVDVGELQRKRFLLLDALYEASNGVAEKLIDTKGFRERLGFAAREAWEIRLYLAREGLLKYGGGGGAEGWTSITHAGAREVEDARLKPTDPTTHFEANIVTHIQSLAVGPGGIVQFGHGTNASTVSRGTLGETERAAIIEALSALSTAAQQSDEADVVAEIDEAKVKIADPTVSTNRVVAALVAVATLVQGVASLPGAYQVFKGAIALVFTGAAQPPPALP